MQGESFTPLSQPSTPMVLVPDYLKNISVTSAARSRVRDETTGERSGDRNSGGSDTLISGAQFTQSQKGERSSYTARTLRSDPEFLLNGLPFDAFSFRINMMKDA
jgi:hypothetical protein